MKISVILAHPDKSSFNHAIAAVAVQVLRDAARDFQLGSAMLSKHFGSKLFPLRSTVVTHLFAIELHLKG